MEGDKNRNSAFDEAAKKALKEIIANIVPLNARIRQDAHAAIANMSGGSSSEDPDAPNAKQFATSFMTLRIFSENYANELSADEWGELNFQMGVLAHDLIGTHFHAKLAHEQIIAWADIRHRQSEGPKKNRDKSQFDDYHDEVVEGFDKYHGGGDKPRFHNWRQRMSDDLTAPGMMISFDPDRLTAFLVKIGKLPNKKNGKHSDGRTK